MSEQIPLIVGFISDLFFTTKVENVARHLGYRIHWIESRDAVPALNEEEQMRERQPGENLFGPEGGLFALLARRQPALLIFDLNNDGVPWREWLPQIKSSSATRRLPVLCFGSHVETEMLQEARRLGADQVVAKSRFTSAMPSLIQDMVRVPNYEAINKACDAPLDEDAIKGIELYNAGEFYEAHEDLEHAWMDDRTPGRNLYRAILQVGVALYQVERGNYDGALKMMLRVQQWLTPLPDTCRSVDVARLREDAERYYEQIIALGRDNLSDFDWEGVRPIRYETSSPLPPGER